VNDIRDLFNGNLLPETIADAHLLNPGKTPPVVLCISYHHLNIIPAPLNTESLFTVERLAKLPCNITHCNTQRPGPSLNTELFLLLPRFKIICDIEGAGIGGDLCF